MVALQAQGDPMAQMTASIRAELRARLQALALIGEALSTEELEAQINQLLAEVLDERPLSAPLPHPLDELPEDQRIVITGMGLITPFGVGVEPFWEGISQGKSAIRRLTMFDPVEVPCKVAGEVLDFEPREFMEPKEARRMSRSSQFAVAAARMAVAMARLRIDNGNREEVGTLIACGSNSMPETEEAARTMLNRGLNRVSPLFIPTSLPNMPASQVALQLGLRGHCSAISTACAAGAQAIGEAAAVIRRGDAEIMLAGGAEASFALLSMGGFAAMRALTTHWEDTPERASRPFDARRSGFVPGEGAGVMVLERLSSARRRGATMYAELISYATTCDAYHITAPEPDGLGAANAMRRALQNARLSPQQVDYINAHATSTPAGDVAETRAIKRAFHEYAHSIPISATKSMIGHLTGAAGAVEAAATVLALKNGLIPPTINLEHPDPECDLDYVPNRARRGSLQVAMSNSFGFGGVNVVLIFRKI
jgi:3-oxoacyl-[acyl-carrier-protein] synthase II